MPQYSTLYATRTPPTVSDGVGGTQPDQTQYLLGTLDGVSVYHGQPGTTVPATATRVLHDGTTPWTWKPIARALTAAQRAAFAPHRWDVEYTDVDVAVADWPMLQATAVAPASST